MTGGGGQRVVCDATRHVNVTRDGWDLENLCEYAQPQCITNRVVIYY